jgi:hypothetical protein
MSSAFPSKQHPSSGENMPFVSGELETRWCGAVGEEVTRFVLQWLEERMNDLSLPTRQRKRIVHVSIEILQNIHHHARGNENVTVFQIIRADDVWHVQSQNEVQEDLEVILQSKWKQLLQLSPKEWRSTQLEKLASTERSMHGGGGVGLNEILRKSDGQVELNFLTHKHGERLVQFSVQISPTS